MRYALLSIVFFCCLLSCGEDGLFHQDEATENDDTELIVENEVQENDANSDEFPVGVVVPVINDQTPLRPDPFKRLGLVPKPGSAIAIKSVVIVRFDDIPPENYRFIASRPVIGKPPEVVRVLQTNSIKIYLDHTYEEGDIIFRILWDGGGVELDYIIYNPDALRVLESSTFFPGRTYFDASKAQNIRMIFNKKLTGTVKFGNELGEPLPWSVGVLEKQNSTVLEQIEPGRKILENAMYSLTCDVTDLSGHHTPITYKILLISKWRVFTIGGNLVVNYLRRETRRIPQAVNIIGVIDNEFVVYTNGTWEMKLRYTFREGFGNRLLDEGLVSRGSLSHSQGKTYIRNVGPDRDVDVSMEIVKGSLYFWPQAPPPKPNFRDKGLVERKPLWVPQPELPAHDNMPRHFLVKNLVLQPKNN